MYNGLNQSHIIIMLTMKSQIMKSNCKDEDYEIEKAPKRCNYKKIKLDIKQEMIKRHFQKGESISDLSKLYHLSYSTIAHILKTFQQKKVVFQSKRCKKLREIEEYIKTQHPQTSQKQNEEEQQCENKIESSTYFPFAPYWIFYCV